ncbi:periplasmic heavy metal sensor [Zhongshania borealis]|uniref:Signaling pathway modulator ZraP n=1 Tax=Zhongshania borealis TaxID=889488 RepID=A0ABP7W5P7_9GAMM
MTSRKGLLLALLISLIVNGAVIGLFIGDRIEGEDRRAMHGMTRQMLRDEPSEFAEPMRLALEAHRGEMRSAYREMRRARHDMVKVLKVPMTSIADINNSFARIRDAEIALKKVSHQVLAEVLVQLPLEQRLHFAKSEIIRRSGGKSHSGERPEKGSEPLIKNGVQ